MNPFSIISPRLLRLSREGFWIAIGQAGVVIGSLLGVRILTGLLPPAEYGELALGLTVATFVGQVLFGPLGNGATRFYALACERGQLGDYVAALRRLILLGTGAVLLAGILAVSGLAAIGRLRLSTIVGVAVVFAILSGYNSSLNGVQNAARQRAVVALHQGLEAWAKFLVAAGLIVLLGAMSSVVLIGYSVAVLIVLWSQYLFFRRAVLAGTTSLGDASVWRRKIWDYSWPFASWGLFTWAQLASDRWSLEFFSTTRDVGLYAVLFRLGYYPMQMASGMALQFLAPIFYQRAGDGRDSRKNADVSRLCRRLTVLILIVTITGVVLTSFFHNEIFETLAGKRYASASGLLPWVLASGGIFAAGQAIALDQLSKLRTRAIAPIKIATAVVGVVLNFVGAYFLGLVGVVLAGVAFSVFYFSWMVLSASRVGRRIQKVS